MQRLTITHVTTYRYRTPVRFGEHRLMFRPRDSHDLRLTDTALTISPQARVRWLHDVFGNSVAIARFGEDSADLLRFESRFSVEHFARPEPVFDVEDRARHLPFAYGADEVPDLGRTLERHVADPDHAVDAWTRQFLGQNGPVRTIDVLAAMARAIHADFTYQTRYEPGVQAPHETLAKGRGTCRDFALLFMEAARSLGIAARFVSGYVYDPALDGAAGGNGQPALAGSGSTHAWAQVYLPGAGWIEFDPTNGIIGGANLIRVAVARDPSQAIPLQGTFIGPGDAFIAMDVSVAVTADPGDNGHREVA